MYRFVSVQRSPLAGQTLACSSGNCFRQSFSRKAIQLWLLAHTAASQCVCLLNQTKLSVPTAKLLILLSAGAKPEAQCMHDCMRPMEMILLEKIWAITVVNNVSVSM